MIVKGIAKVWGLAQGDATDKTIVRAYYVEGPFSSAPASATAGQRMSSVSGGHSAQTDELMDDGNELIGAAISNQRLTLDIEWIPTGVRDANGAPQTGANAIDNALQGLKLPADASSTRPVDGWNKVTLEGIPEPATNSHGLNGDWIYDQGASQDLTPDADGTVRMSLFRPLYSPLTVDQLVAVVS